MDTLFHVVFGFIAGMAVNARLKHKPAWVAAIAVLAVGIDLDHFLFAYSRAFHTVFVTVGVPAVLFYAAYRYEHGRDTIRLQQLVILLCVMLNGHLVADLFNEGVLRPLYPLSGVELGVPSWLAVAVVREGWLVVSPDGVALALYGLVIAFAYYADEFIYFFEQQHEGLSAAIQDTIKS